MGFSEKFEEIRKDRIGVVSSSVYPGIKELVSEIYPDEAHFIYELMQNAEDAEAAVVEFMIKDDKLIFRHNGKKLFDDVDIDGITNIGKSAKKNNYVQAGKFGIGFKSVYAFTETPSIYCDSVNFKIEKLLLPTLIGPLDGREKGWTEFHFPFDSEKITAENAKHKIKQGLLEIESTTLLFLHNINTINYFFEDESKYQVIKEVRGNMVKSSVYSNGVLRSQNTWKRYSRITTLHGKDITVDLAFPMELTTDKKYKFVSGQDKVFITFLAKNERSNLRFYVNAPFGCTPSRDTVNKGDEDNKILIRELAILTADVIEELKEENLLTDEFFNLLPIDDDEISDFYKPIVYAIYDTFKKKSCLPTMNNGYVIIDNGIMSSRDVIDKAFTIKDVRKIFGNPQYQFVKNRPVNSRAYKFLKQLNIKELTAISVLTRLYTIEKNVFDEWITTLTDKQLTEVYKFLHRGIVDLQKDCDKYESYKHYADPYYANSEYYKEQYEYSQIYRRVFQKLQKIKSLCIVKTDRGEFVQPVSVRILLQDIDVPKEYRIVNRNLLAEKNAVDFLKAIGVQEFTEKELELYKYGQEKTDFIRKIHEISMEDDPLAIARMILCFFDTHQENEIDMSNLKYVLTERLVGCGDTRKGVFASPKDCYIDAPYVEENGFRYAENIHKKKLVSSVYVQLEEKERAKWIAFLMRQGIYHKLTVEKKYYSTGYATGYHDDYETEYLRQYINLKNKVLNKYIWGFFQKTENWNCFYAISTKKINRNYAYRREDSSVIKILKNAAWVLDNTGKFRTPASISFKNIADGWEINEGNGFLCAIDFSAEQNKVDQKIKEQEELERLQQETRRNAATLLGFDNAEAVVAAKESLRMIEELEQMGVNLRELYDSKKKERNVKKYSITQQLQNMRENEFRVEEMDSDGEVFGVPNPERRSQKLKQTMSEEKEPDKKSVIAKRSIINQEEKHFVGTEYSGRCQVCSKTIYKKDGTRHYVAINLLDTGHLEDKYLIGLSTGWNTLCLCPNCAAEFKYGAISLCDFEEKVKSIEIVRGYRDFYEFAIQMQGENRTLRYTPKHLMALKTSLEYFEKNKDVGDVDDNQQNVVSEIGVLEASEDIINEVTVVKTGDRCPQCGKSNAISSTFHVCDKDNIERAIEGRICSCGTKYLTRKQWNKVEFDVKVNMVDGSMPIHKAVAKRKSNVIVNIVRCPKCGVPGELFSNKGMCWSCYKDEMSSRFD